MAFQILEPEKMSVGNSPLMIVIESRHAVKALSLIESGCDLNNQNQQGMTALMFSIFYQQTEVTLKLIEMKSCDVNLRNHENTNALILA
jgi:ankyrin repeat protein